MNERTMSHFPVAAPVGAVSEEAWDSTSLDHSHLGTGKMAEGKVCNQTVLCAQGPDGTDETTKKTISLGYCIVNNYFSVFFAVFIKTFQQFVSVSGLYQPSTPLLSHPFTFWFPRRISPRQVKYQKELSCLHRLLQRTSPNPMSCRSSETLPYPCPCHHFKPQSLLRYHLKVKNTSGHMGLLFSTWTQQDSVHGMRSLSGIYFSSQL